MGNTLNYSISDSIIETVITIPNSNTDFKNQITKIVLKCIINVEGIEDPFTLRFSRVLPVPEDISNYIDLENITKEQLVNWVMEFHSDKISGLIERFYRQKMIQNNPISENQEPKVVEEPIILSGDNFN